MVQKTENKIPKYKLRKTGNNQIIVTLLLVIHITIFIFTTPFILFGINLHYPLLLLFNSFWSIFLSFHTVLTILLYRDYSTQKNMYLIHLSVFITSIPSGIFLALFVQGLFFIISPLWFLWSLIFYFHYRNYKSDFSQPNDDLNSSKLEEINEAMGGSIINEQEEYEKKITKKHRTLLIFLLLAHLIIYGLFFPQIVSIILYWEYYYNWAAILLLTVIWSWIFSLHITFTIFYFRDYSYEKMKLLTHLAIYISSLVISLLIFDMFFLLVIIILPIWTIILVWHFQEYKSLKNYETEDGGDIDQWFEEVEGFSEESLRKIAEEKVKYRDSVKIHFFTYILINILLFVLFLILEIPQISILIFFAWLIGLSLHTVSYILYARGTFPTAKRVVVYHFITYLTGSIFLIVLNVILITTSRSPQFISSISSIMSIVIIIWGLALLLHWAIYKLFFSVKIEKNGEIKTRREMQIEKEIQKMKRKLMRE